jgi:hypothetical protein
MTHATAVDGFSVSVTANLHVALLCISDLCGDTTRNGLVTEVWQKELVKEETVFGSERAVSPL